MEGLNVSNYVRSKRFASITRREPREGRVWLILEVAALFFSIGRQHPHGGAWWLLGCVTAAGAKAIRHWDRAFRRRSKMEHAQRSLGHWRILVWLLIGNSDVGGLSLACPWSVCATCDIGRESQHINACSFRQQGRYSNAPSMDVSVV